MIVGGLVVVAALVVGGLVVFGGDDENGASPATTGADGTSTETTVAGSGQAIAAVDEASGAVIRIETEGTIRDPEFGQTSNAGAGSGFIIDPSGIAVTNNHVVTGAATLDVFVGGSAEPVSARVLGVSECSDLAVIDLEGEGYPFLNWFDDEIRPGIDVFAAGFPLDDPEFTLTGGIVSKASADDISPSSNIDHVIEHDANIQPGNSGGPLITEDALVVGVNYAGFDFAGTGTEQFFAIASDTAQPIVAQLQEGENVDSLGINGTAVSDEESGTFGLWVNAVDAGSPASNLGLEPGDIITRMAGVDVGLDGTMKDYCDILRTKGQDAAIGVEVLRFDTSEVLRGEFNGQELELAFSFADELGETGDTYENFSIVTDDSNTIQVEVPDEWADVRGEAQEIAGVLAPSIQASPDVDAFINTFDVPGMEFVLTDQFTSADFETIMDAIGPSELCTSAGREDYEDPLFTGRFEVWESCQGTDASYIVVAAAEADSTSVAIVTVQAIDDRDFDALDRILATFSTTSTVLESGD